MKGPEWQMPKMTPRQPPGCSRPRHGVSLSRRITMRIAAPRNPAGKWPPFFAEGGATVAELAMSRILGEARKGRFGGEPGKFAATCTNYTCTAPGISPCRLLRSVPNFHCPPVRPSNRRAPAATPPPSYPRPGIGPTQPYGGPHRSSASPVPRPLTALERVRVYTFFPVSSNEGPLL